MSRTFIMIKPDATERNLVGDIIQRLEKSGFCIEALCSYNPLPRASAEFLYAEHRERLHFPLLIDYTLSGLVVTAVVKGETEDTARRVRELVGPSDPQKALAGTIRRDFGLDFRRNSIHASDGEESAAREISFFFSNL